jgi:hypothetical protein
LHRFIEVSVGIVVALAVVALWPEHRPASPVRTAEWPGLAMFIKVDISSSAPRIHFDTGFFFKRSNLTIFYLSAHFLRSPIANS